MSCKLRVAFQTEEAFVREYADSISKGGIFVPTRRELAVRDRVSVELVLAAAGETIELSGEVVHCIPEELAATGAQPGVAIQFLPDADAVREKLAPFAPARSEALNEQSFGAGRRTAPRSPLRVLAQVLVGDRWVDGRTRNVSSAGMLVALQGDPVPIGRSVRVSLAHPTTHEEIELDGVVRRHVESSGETCVGVEFRIPETQHAEFDGFLRRLGETEHNRRLGGINGPIGDLGIERLLRMFGDAAPEGTLTLSRGDAQAVVSIEHGELRAQLGVHRGREAFDALLEWADGQFEFEARVEPGYVSGPAVSLAELFGELEAEGADRGPGGDVEETEEDCELELLDVVGGAPEAEPDDEWDLGDEIPGEQLSVDVAPIADSASLSLADGARDDLPGDLSKTEQALLDLAGVGVTVGKAVEIIPEPAPDVYAALSSLIAVGRIAVR